ncbi:isoprenyl transferase [Marinigracilibium pacificum]|uniref:Isoprenyl transferase n=1 Tax=Marinigracilibium pacificum TaxID=2729599 RepID=A0A848IZ36_9BACT|nr:isoprenyl transferase [Marinigracilibium pacificum]NMM49793.1 isoprenyl transferase [Marinigracilibium pacificum]
MEHIDKSNIPSHIAVIMDGNGRWAKKKGAMRLFGHKNAVNAVREVTEGCAEIGVQYLTLYAFSTENWNRPKDEVSGLMELLVGTIRKELKTLTKNNVRLHTIGDTESLPEKCKRELLEAIDRTKENTGLNLILALSYSGRWEITQAMKKIADQVSKGELDPEEINESTIAKNLMTAPYPDPELMIRTSGEMRISNYLLWQSAYTELYFTETLWPDFNKEELANAILSYQRRERRFGKISEQLKSDA